MGLEYATVAATVFQRKNIRLGREKYRGRAWHFVTFCCWDRHLVFKSAAACHWFVQILRSESSAYCFAIHAYCLMPDHVHLLAEGTESNSDLLLFMKSLKHTSSVQFEQKTGKILWQKKFYDHILRQNDQPDRVAWYIWLNPVRAHLCVTAEDYPFSGSFTGAWPKTSRHSPEWLPVWKSPSRPKPNQP